MLWYIVCRLDKTFDNVFPDISFESYIYNKTNKIISMNMHVDCVQPRLFI